MKITETEKQFSELIARKLKLQNYITQTEIDTGYGIADVVAIRVNEKHVKKRFSYNQFQTILNENYFKVLGLLGESRKSAKHLSEIENHLSITNSYLKSIILKDLISNGFVKEIDNKTYIKVNGWTPLSDEIIAIESKLHNWDRGITQALRYKKFADKTYLALPQNKVHLVNRGLLKKYNVGLLTLRDNRVLFLVNPIPQKKEISEPKRNFVCEHFWDQIKAKTLPTL